MMKKTNTNPEIGSIIYIKGETRAHVIVRKKIIDEKEYVFCARVYSHTLANTPIGNDAKLYIPEPIYGFRNFAYVKLDIIIKRPIQDITQIKGNVGYDMLSKIEKGISEDVWENVYPASSSIIGPKKTLKRQYY